MKKTILALAIAGFALQASATVLDFESLAAPDDNFGIGTNYTEKGFALNDVGGSSAFGFASWGTANLYGYYTGSTALMNQDFDALTQLTVNGGGHFNLNAIDLAVMFPGVLTDGVNITFTGTKADSTTVSESFLVADGAAQNFSFVGFADLTKVTWTADSNMVQFDNINVVAVPEPETYAMFMAGLAVIGGVARRRLPR